jgi:hypothetical protein
MTIVAHKWQSGIYFSNEERLVGMNFGIQEIGKFDCLVNIPSLEYPTCKRPAFSLLDKSKIKISWCGSTSL